MSKVSKTFQVNLSRGGKATIVAANVTLVTSNADVVTIHTNAGDTIGVTDSYRSVRGYLNKALGEKSEVEQADSAE